MCDVFDKMESYIVNMEDWEHVKIYSVRYTFNEVDDYGRDKIGVCVVIATANKSVVFINYDIEINKDKPDSFIRSMEVFNGWALDYNIRASLRNKKFIGSCKYKNGHFIPFKSGVDIIKKLEKLRNIF